MTLDDRLFYWSLLPASATQRHLWVIDGDHRGDWLPLLRDETGQ